MKHTQTLEKPTTKKASSNLFAIAQQQAPEKKSSKKDKETFQVKGLKNELSRYEELKALIKNSEAEMEVIAGTIKQAGKEKFLEVFENKGKKPESFHIADGEEKVLYIVQDAYKGDRSGMSQEKIDLFADHPEILETTTTFTFNPDVVNRIGDKLSQVIMSSKLISDEDKKNLIIATSKTTIKKGTIEKLLEFDNPAMMFELIEPIVALK
jgi:hypothetical protein